MVSYLEMKKEYCATSWENADRDEEDEEDEEVSSVEGEQDRSMRARVTK